MINIKEKTKINIRRGITGFASGFALVGTSFGLINLYSNGKFEPIIMEYKTYETKFREYSSKADKTYSKYTRNGVSFNNALFINNNNELLGINLDLMSKEELEYVKYLIQTNNKNGIDKVVSNFGMLVINTDIYKPKLNDQYVLVNSTTNYNKYENHLANDNDYIRQVAGITGLSLCVGSIFSVLSDGEEKKKVKK